jgi:hypothetical protein
MLQLRRFLTRHLGYPRSNHAIQPQLYPRNWGVLGAPDDNISLTLHGAGNLITHNDSDGVCPGVVSTSDPALQALTLNSPGNTPTMAILANSPAFQP